MHKKKLFLVYPVYSTFIKRDEAILSKHYSIHKHHFQGSKNPFKLTLELIKLFVACIQYLPQSDIVLNWFAGYHSLFPSLIAKVLGKKNYVIIAGYDGVSIPSIKFGVFWKKNPMTFFARKTYILANRILPVDDSLEQGMNYYADPTNKGYPIGVKSFMPKIKNKFVTIPFGFNSQIWKPVTGIERKNAVICIGSASTKKIFERKGFDFLIEVARKMPQVAFTIVGLRGEMMTYAKSIASENVELIGFVNHDEILRLLSEHKVYVQFSMSEGQPNTLGEAMACGCIPVGSNVNGIPSTIGNYGFVLESKTIEQAIQLINKALTCDNKLGIQARQRIIDHYSEELREQRLLNALSS